jgi:hypothetical protein
MADEMKNLVIFIVVLSLAALLLALGYYFATIIFPQISAGPPPPGFYCPLCRIT